MVVDIPYPPAAMIGMSTGAIDVDQFDMIGNEFLGYFRAFAKLQPNHAVLDVGCGVGRMARALAGYLNEHGLYRGFDISRSEIEWCQGNITPRFPNFVFAWSDVRNTTYNPTGKFAPETFRFPFNDETFDFAFVASVFTHMLPPGLNNYLSEVRRVLRKGENCLITYFLLNEDQTECLRQNPDRAAFTFPFRKDGDPYAIQFLENPEHVIGYDESYIRERHEALGLAIHEPVHYGSWPGRQKYLSGQDIVVSRKR